MNHCMILKFDFKQTIHKYICNVFFKINLHFQEVHFSKEKT